MSVKNECPLTFTKWFIYNFNRTFIFNAIIKILI